MDLLTKLAPANVGLLLAPKLQDFPQEGYEGLEFRSGRFTFRPAQFVTEGLMLGLVLVYFFISMLGTSMNSKRAMAWVKAHQSLYDTQFAKPGVSNVLNDGPTDFLVFSTGRRAVAYLQTVISLFPRHDLLQWAYEFGWSMMDLSYSREDTLVLDFKLSNTTTPGFVWGLVHRNVMNSLRKERFDLTYFTKTTESGPIPSSTILMSESADVTDLVIKSPAGIKVLADIADPALGKYFRSIIITDQPDKRPTQGAIPAEKKERRLIISLVLPPPSESAVTERLIQDVLSLIDFLDAKTTLREDVARKLARARTELDGLLTRELTEPTAEEKEELEEAKRAAKKKAEDEKFALMTPDQQRKYEEKERKKAIRKTQSSKMVYK